MSITTHKPTETVPRIVIYGTGQYGCHIARLALQRGWTIVAAVNRAGNKVGKDLGPLAKLGKDIGVVVQDCDTVDFRELSADIGIVTVSNLLSVNADAHERLLSAGINVLCHGSESYFPYGCDSNRAEALEALALSNQVSFTGGGIWDMSRIWSGILLLGPCTDIKSLYHSSITDIHGQVAAFEQAAFIGVGLSKDGFYQRGLDKAPFGVSYKTIVEHVLWASGYTVNQSDVTIEPVIYSDAIDNPWGGEPIAAGVCVGTRIVATINTAEGVTAKLKIELKLFQREEVEHVFWSVDGNPRNELLNNRKDSDLTTAGCLFNRIKDVISAPPGIVPVSKLGPLKHSAMTD
ncbi:4-hydroxy-tetrahydrodipicolinate reductase [Spongiibacter sp. IMCC21906]|uniref:hypothetical protein n=1 Tax=Spongiibacter sp. IMCC21906 TaxID=1620392 RepID=UPI00062DEDBE|nr:hypothetical protein [Spongiibacter sp. IMCC21906]AKH68007.1 4-hydroxy-tetrahydrodipicolinate reductase [Spongiibacter sp. IMCC21906]